jgi:hypothetical protein
VKVTISPTGEIQLETNGSSPAEIAALVRELQQQNDKPNGPAPVSLGTLMAETWDFLAEHDNPKGIHLQAVAQHFKISKEAAGQRMQGLVNDGHAERVSAGRYRATDGGLK